MTVKMNSSEDGIGYILTSYSVTDDSSVEILNEDRPIAIDVTDSLGNLESCSTEYDSAIYIQRNVSTSFNRAMERFKEGEECSVNFEQDNHDVIDLCDIKILSISRCYVALKKLTQRVIYSHTIEKECALPEKPLDHSENNGDIEANVKTPYHELNNQCDVDLSCNTSYLNEGIVDYENIMTKMWTISDVYYNYLDHFDDVPENKDVVSRSQELEAKKQENNNNIIMLPDINDGEESFDKTMSIELEPCDNYINIHASSSETEPKTQTLTTHTPTSKSLDKFGEDEQCEAPPHITVEKDEVMLSRINDSDSETKCHFASSKESLGKPEPTHKNGQSTDNNGQACNQSGYNGKSLKDTFVDVNNVAKKNKLVSGKQFGRFQNPSQRNTFDNPGRSDLRIKSPREIIMIDKEIDSNTAAKLLHVSNIRESISSVLNLNTQDLILNKDKAENCEIPKSLKEFLSCKTNSKKVSLDTLKKNSPQISKQNQLTKPSYAKNKNKVSNRKLISLKHNLLNNLNTEISVTKINNSSKSDVPLTEITSEISCVVNESCQKKKTVVSKVIELSKCIQSWSSKYPWMVFDNNIFSCKLCQEPTHIFKLEKNRQIYLVSAHLRQHEATDGHRKVSVISRNMIIQKVIVDYIRARSNYAVFLSKDLFYCSLINHVANVANMKTTKEELEVLITEIFIKFHGLESRYIENLAKNGISFIVDECRRLIIIRMLNYWGLPIEIMSFKFLDNNSTFEEYAKKYPANPVYCKYVQCGSCQTCLKNTKPYDENTLPIRYPTISCFVSFIEHDPAVTRYADFLKTIASHYQYIAIQNVHWTSDALFAYLKTYFSRASTPFLYIDLLLQLIDVVGKTVLKRRVLQSYLARIDFLLVNLKGILSDVSINFIQLFLKELNHKCYIDGLQNLRDFDCVLKLQLLVKIQYDFNLTNAFRKVFNIVKNHLTLDSPDVMIVYLYSFGVFVANEMPNFNFTLSEILHKFHVDEPFRQTFHHIYIFYKTIALLPCFGAYWETPLINATACVNGLLKNAGKPLALQILQIMNSDNSVVQNFFEEKQLAKCQ